MGVVPIVNENDTLAVSVWFPIMAEPGKIICLIMIP